MDRRDHWTHVYQTRAPEQASWYQADPARSLSFIQRTGLPLDAPLIDVGGGASLLVDLLVAAGHSDITVLDIAEAALDHVRARLSDHPAVTLIVADILAFTPARRYTLWHDRAVFHFLTDPCERATYRRVLSQALAPQGHLLVATFAEDGPQRCSGLEVQRYSADALVAEFGSAFHVCATERETHMTPAGALQHFQYAWLRRSA